MRTALWGIVVAGSTLAGSLSLYTGCGTLPDDCRERFDCGPGDGGSSSGASTSTTTSTSTGAGGDSGPPPGCVPTAGQEPVADTCGVFVSAKGDDTAPGVGSKLKPYKTLTAAVAAAAAAKARVYACAETFTETVTVTAGVGIYGGLDCAKQWAYTEGARSTLTTVADAVPLTLSDTASGVELFDFKVQAVPALLAGGSSIAVIANQVTASLTRCDLVAGKGKDGLAGTMSTGSWPSPTSPAVRGNDGRAACPALGSSQLGGEAKDNMLCPSANGGPIGGDGGNGGITLGGNGAVSPANAQTALGGTGQAASDPMMNCVTGSGQPGAPGMSGGNGEGAIGTSAMGQLGLSGYVGVAGKDGVDGKPGQGGGGGGGARGKTMCAGASGGGGGTGGCGGQGGTGGTAGGASIALVSLGATLSFATVTVTLGAGGAGGDGGDGQFGGAGGIGGLAGLGNGTASACRGGDGGQGGVGGKGGGGRGGHALGIAASGGKAPVTKGVTFLQKGTAGSGGKGGPLQGGDPGVQTEVMAFP